jgi:hypothetical protein
MKKGILKLKQGYDLSEIEEEAAPNENNGLPKIQDFDSIFEDAGDNSRKKPLFVVQVNSKQILKAGEKCK